MRPADIPQPVCTWRDEQGCGAVVQSRPVGGGCINNGVILHTASGKRFFLKTNTHTPADMFVREAEGLEALRGANGPRVPQVFLVGDDFLLMEDLNPARPVPTYWTDFGRLLAALHNHTHTHFGFHHDNYLGSTPQPNPWVEDGFAFFAEHRLLYQARLAHQRGLLDRAGVRQVEKLAAALPDLIPAQPASLIHGDLWSGNAITDSTGRPAIIDPAAHYGWAEAELGMTALFGGFPESFYRAYQEARPLPPGLYERLPIYNLYHLLKHLNLFGRSYLNQVRSILNRYAG